jgi:hypothetical protein
VRAATSSSTWDYEAGRPAYLTEVDYDSHDLRLITRQHHERELESITWMAANGHLTEAEIEIIQRKRQEARERVGTAREQKAACSPDYGGDKLRVALAERMLVAGGSPPASLPARAWVSVLLVVGGLILTAASPARRPSGGGARREGAPVRRPLRGGAGPGHGRARCPPGCRRGHPSARP